MAVANMDNIMYLSENTIYQSSLDRTAADAADALVETPGVPYNWEQGGNVSSVGLASYDISTNTTVKNILSPSKVAAMNITQLQNLIGPNYGAYMTLTIANNSNATVIKTLGSYNNSSSNIIRMERFVSTSNLQLAASLQGTIRDAGFARTYTLTFPTNNYYTNIYDYWVLIVNNKYTSVPVSINGNNLINGTEINQGVTLMKRKINSTFLYNNSTVQNNVLNVNPAVSPGASMDIYVIAAPAGTSSQEITLENVKLRNAKLVLYVWTR